MPEAAGGGQAGRCQEDARETGTLVPEDTLRPFPLEVKRGDETKLQTHTHTQDVWGLPSWHRALPTSPAHNLQKH